MSKHILKRNFYYLQKCFTPTAYKFRLVCTLLHCCFNITFFYQTFHNEINAVNEIFSLNEYHILFIKRCLKHCIQKPFVTMAIQNKVNNDRKIVTTKLYKKPLTVLIIKISFSIQIYSFQSISF